MQNLKYKTEKHLKARVTELATINKKLLNTLLLTVSDLEHGCKEGLGAEAVEVMLKRVLDSVKESENGTI